ncbi:hypothetical protein ACROYT_G035018 [Oculina patagonica]
MFGWINRRCKEATGHITLPFGGLSIILVGDIGQLPSISDQVIYHNRPKSDIALEGYCMYRKFETVVKFEVNERAKGADLAQQQFRDLQIRARDGNSNLKDWNLLLYRAPQTIDNIANFKTSAVRLSFGNEKVAKDNFARLKQLGEKIFEIKANHSNPKAKKLSAEEMGGLEPTIHLSKKAKVMLTRNLWTKAGLCNGAMGTVRHIIVAENHAPSMLPIAIIVQFHDEDYIGPSFCKDLKNCVPIYPVTSFSSDGLERQQFPLKLAWSITIHKSQGLTLKNCWIDLGTLSGYVQLVHEIKKSSNTSNNYFDFVLQVAEDESRLIRVMINKGDISKYNLMVAKRESEQPILLSNLRTVPGGTIFMNQNATIKDLPSHAISFAFTPISSNDVTSIGIILEKHNTGMFNISGKMTWHGTETIVKDKEGKEKRVRDARIADKTGHIEVSLWGNQIDKIEDEQFYSISNCRLKHFYGKKLSTTEKTTITTAEKQEIANQPIEKRKTIVCCPEILNVLVNIYIICNNRECRKKVSASSGSKILRCNGCNRAMLLKNCYVEVNAQFQLEKDSAEKYVTAFANVLTKFLEEDVYTYKDKEDDLTTKLLLLENVDFHLSNNGKLVTSMTRHVQESKEEDEEKEKKIT